jgi:hypothetical protein
MQRVIEMEEEEVDPVTGWPVERKRFWSCVINADMDRNGGFWAFFTPAAWMHERMADGRYRMREEFFVL